MLRTYTASIRLNKVTPTISDVIAFGALLVSGISIIGSGVILTFKASIAISKQLASIEAILESIKNQNQELRTDVNAIEVRLSDLEEIIKINHPEWFRRRRDGNT